MKDQHTNEDGTVTATWSGRTILNARRGFFLGKIPQWPTGGLRSIRVVDTDRNGFGHVDWVEAYMARRKEQP